jgi:hypothetical protein
MQSRLSIICYGDHLWVGGGGVAALHPPPPGRGIIAYLEYQSVCPIVGIGSPPSPAPWSQRGGNTHSQVRGSGGPNSDDWTESLHCKKRLADFPSTL